MIAWFRSLDELLKGRLTLPEQLAEGRLKLSMRRFVPLAVVLGLSYGFFMGWYAILLYWGGTAPDPHRLQQAVASTVKLPLLFLLTLVVTFPSLYVFNALFGCQTNFTDTLRLLTGAVTINLAVAASLGPILGFFTLSTTSYPFMVLLNVVLLGIAGFIALSFLLQTLRRIIRPPLSISPPAPAQAPTMHDSQDLTSQELDARQPVPPPGLLDGPLPATRAETLGQARTVFQIWVLIYALVGAQMGWILRPFIGSPSIEFHWFRPRSGNFFSGLISGIQCLLGAH